MAHSDPNIISSSSAAASNEGGDDSAARLSTYSAYDPSRLSGDGGSPMMMSPWNQPSSPFSKSPWHNFNNTDGGGASAIPQTGLIGSLVREEGHIYSLAAKDDVLYTGSDSKNIRAWKNLEEFAAFKSTSGLVKAIIVSSGGKIFTGHQDGKIRVWRRSNLKNPSLHKRVGTMPTFFDIFKASIRRKNYVEVKKKKTAIWIKHTDAISCLSMNEQIGLLYSASWDRTIKVWRVENSKCIESVKAHDDAVNSVVSSVDGLVYTGSADGTVKVWKREQNGKTIKHVLTQTLLSQESAVTALAVNDSGSVVYCGSSDGMVNFWLLEKQLSHGGVLKGHKLAVLCLAAAGNMVFSGSADKTICVWRRDGQVHTCLSVLSGHTGPVKCLVAEEDREEVAEGGGGREKKWKVYSGSLDKSVKVWRVSEMAAADVAFMQRRDGGGGDYSWDSVPSAKY